MGDIFDKRENKGFRGDKLKIQAIKCGGSFRLLSRISDNLLTQTVKFCLVGLLNTALTAAVIFTLIHVGTNIYLANLIGYAVGIVCSFILNCLFTFSISLSCRRLGKFLVTCFAAYLVNVGVIGLVVHSNSCLIYSSQIAGMATYTITSFLFSKLWAMR